MTASLYDDVTTPHHTTRYWKHPVLSATSDTIRLFLASALWCNYCRSVYLYRQINGPGKVFMTFKSIKIKDREASLANKQTRHCGV